MSKLIQSPIPNTSLRTRVRVVDRGYANDKLSTSPQSPIPNPW